MISELAIFEDVDENAEESADADALAELDTKRVISHEAMKAWLLSWGTPDELPAPSAGA